MSLEAARAMLEATADYGTGELQAYARRVLERWGAQQTPETRQGPMSGAERSRRWRDEQRRKRDEAATERNGHATAGVTDRNGDAGDPSRALPLPHGASSISSSSPAPSPSEPLDLGVAGGSTGAGARGEVAAADGDAAACESGTFALEAPSAQRRTSRGVTKRDDAKRGPIPEDWKPSADVIAWCEGQGLDAMAMVPEFIDHWRGQHELGKKDAQRPGWDRTFRQHVRRLVGWGRAPELPPRPPAPPPKGDPAQAGSVADYLNGNRMPAILAAKEGKRA